MRLLPALLLLLSHALCAQEPLCLVERFGVEEGLLNRRVSAIVQDREGFLWIGTPGGLHRFDGYAFKTFTTADGLASNAVDDIWMDADGLLWLVRGGGRSDLQAVSIDIVEPHTGRIATFEDHFGSKAPLRAAELLPESCSAQDSTLILSATGRLIRYHPRSGFTVQQLTAGLDLIPSQTTTRGTTWGTVERTGPGHNSFVVRTHATVTRTDTVLTGKNIFWSIVGNAAFMGDTFERNGRYLTVEKEDGRSEEWWLTTSRAPVLVRTGDLSEAWWERIRTPLGEDLWLVGTTVRRMKPGDDPLAAPVVFDIAKRIPDIVFHLFTTFRDRTGHIWIGGEFGLYRLVIHPNPFQRLLWSAEIPQGHGVRIRGMTVANGSLFVNAEQEGRWELDARTGEVLRVDTTMLSRLALVPDGENGFWGGEGDSLTHRTMSGARTARGIDVTGYPVWCLLPMEADGLLAGTTNGLGWVDRALGRYTPMNSGPGAALQGATVVDLARDRAGKIWISTSVGLFNADETGQVIKRWWNGARAIGDTSHYLPASDFRHFRQDRDGIIWLATADAGLLRWDRATGEVRAISRREGLASNSVYASYADDLGQLWLPTDNGIARYDPPSGLVQNYSTTEGITHNEFNRLAHTQGPDGRLYFGGLNGITAFDPQTLRNMRPGQEAPLVITEARQFVAATDHVEDHTIAVRDGAGIRMAPGDRYFTVSMALLSFEEPARISYGWRIDGVDADWNYQHEPNLRIAALPYGDHMLRIKAQGSNGVWSGELAIPVVFERPIHLRWWFITLGAVAFLALVIWVVRSRFVSEQDSARAEPVN